MPPQQSWGFSCFSIARTFYSMLKNGSEYVDQGQDYYEQQYRDRITKNLKKRAADMGFELVPKEETEEALRLASAVG